MLKRLVLWVILVSVGSLSRTEILILLCVVLFYAGLWRRRSNLATKAARCGLRRLRGVGKLGMLLSSLLFRWVVLLMAPLWVVGLYIIVVLTVVLISTWIGSLKWCLTSFCQLFQFLWSY